MNQEENNSNNNKKERRWIGPISLREIVDNDSSISSTRWAFASIVKFDIFVILITALAGLAAHFIPGVEDLDSGFYTSMGMLLGILTGFISGTKALQGFEPGGERLRTKKEEEKKEEKAVKSFDDNGGNDEEEEKGRHQYHHHHHDPEC